MRVLLIRTGCYSDTNYTLVRVEPDEVDVIKRICKLVEAETYDGADVVADIEVERFYEGEDPCSWLASSS